MNVVIVRCLRCKAGPGWIEGRVEIDQTEAKRLDRVRAAWIRVAEARDAGSNEDLRDALATLGDAINGE